MTYPQGGPQYPQHPYGQPQYGQQYPPPQQWPPAHRPAPKKAKKWPWIVGGLVALMVVGSIANGGKSSSATATPTANTAAAATTKPPVTNPKTIPIQPAPQSGPATSATSGTYEVGVDLAAGRYKTTGPGESFMKNCYWARRSNDSGGLDSIIANDNIQGPGSVTIKKGEFIEFSGKCEWVKQ